MTQAATADRPQSTRRPLSLQARLMITVTGIVSIILVIVAIVTSATLGRTLEDRLDQQLRATASDAARWTTQSFLSEGLVPSGHGVTATRILTGNRVPPGILLAVDPRVGASSGAVVEPTDTSIGEIRELGAAQLTQLSTAIAEQPVTVHIDGLGSYRIVGAHSAVGDIVVGLPRTEVLRTLTALFTTLVLATLGGLIMLAVATAITIRVGLRPLREVAETATRVANQPLSEGAVSITERVPATESDPRTEIGAVGASLNTLLDHIDTSLAARQRNEERMRRFVADASHELRTPLASIRGYSELSLKALERDPDPQTAAQTASALERIQAQSLRMTRLVEDLLLLARLDEGSELVSAPVDLSALALEGLADARPTGPDHHWRVSVPDEPIIVPGDAGRLHQVLANLLANARTHTPAGTTITVEVTRDADHAVLRVHDDGPGIDPEVRDVLFSRFARGDASRTRQTGGTGLGLAIAKAIVEGHGGRLTVTSEPGSTTFEALLPLT